ncbi:hypothetical protein PtA15_8A441 [Puccinia triticina]|uniref:Uncharacterized protein n=1 Tax=Puccinia triticina TaxID=208348 RepID=A0ABY7CXU2_9BASI|nr:uncharacterized protein PtA15_8A441 [Puccinia triticina]WAQ87537.1 hypothetical protein PtA15_8A441 [Puccinia triticina]
MQLCTCSRCVTHTVFDQHGQLTSGKYLAARSIAIHCSEDFRRSRQNETFDNSADDLSDSPPLELPESSEYSEDSGAFSGLDENKDNTHLFFIIFFMPRDPRTLISRADLDPELVDSICCQTCFRLYPQDVNAPMVCEYKPFTSSRPCDEELFTQKTTHLDFRLLAKPDTEEAIDAWARELSRSDEVLMDVQHGSNYQNMDWGDSTPPPESAGSDSDDMETSLDRRAPLNLILSLFVDWFNPRGNKTSGKVESTGVFALTCLNLPPFLQNKISHICLAGITPGPYSPDTSTINHLLKPIVDELGTLEPGVMIKTHQYPNGRFVRV